MSILSSGSQASTYVPDEHVLAVASELTRICALQKKSPVDVFSRIVRQALDEVIDGRRTGRYAVEQLAAEEKKYIGTKLEIVFRSELELEKSADADVLIGEISTEIKWSLKLEWMIGPENVGKVCLGLGLQDGGKRFSVGIFRPTSSVLRKGSNRDSKMSLTAEARRGHVLWFVEKAPLPSNFIAELSPQVRAAILGGRSAQDRVRKLFQLLPGIPVPRSAIETVARNKRDPMRRLRQDKYNPDALPGMKLLSTKYGRLRLRKLGLPPLPPDHWMAVPIEAWESGE